ncbi:predicted protein [Plenodomus lingam JN3]|uniref:Predicted protein n=1 Tax=Leptosphaeria maculans (strain JN3 / isolate v23.1.3 / race Av1-4-5-6-7-8) TaxID=985895 RepID=E4ZM27_LEPMJ|nr:predicted protein [Plenodomus lingam JN3]CBX92376.1 predicted protein [Plenodomus lingam JN3]
MHSVVHANKPLHLLYRDEPSKIGASLNGAGGTGTVHVGTFTSDMLYLLPAERKYGH